MGPPLLYILAKSKYFANFTTTTKNFAFMRNIVLKLTAIALIVISQTTAAMAQETPVMLPHNEVIHSNWDVFGKKYWHFGYQHTDYTGFDLMARLDSIYGFIAGTPRKPYELTYTKLKGNKRTNLTESVKKTLILSDTTWKILDNLYQEAAKSMRIGNPDYIYMILDGPCDSYYFVYMGNVGYSGNEEGTNCKALQEISETICEAILQGKESLILDKKDEIISLTEKFRNIYDYRPAGGYEDYGIF